MNKNKIIEMFDEKFVEHDEDGSHIYEAGDVKGIHNFLLSIPTSILMELRRDCERRKVKESKIEKIKLMSDFEQKIEAIKMGHNKALSDILALIDKKINELK